MFSKLALVLSLAATTTSVGSEEGKKNLRRSPKFAHGIAQRVPFSCDANYESTCSADYKVLTGPGCSADTCIAQNEGCSVAAGAGGLTLQQCKDSCDSTADCYSFAFRAAGGACWLKGKIVGPDTVAVDNGSEFSTYYRECMTEAEAYCFPCTD